MPLIDTSAMRHDAESLVSCAFFSVFFLAALANLCLAATRRRVFSAKMNALSPKDTAPAFWLHLIFWVLCLLITPYLMTKSLNLGVSALGVQAISTPTKAKP